MHFDIGLLLVIAVVIMALIVLADKLLFARKRTKEDKEPTIVDIARSVFPVVLIVLVLRSFVFEPFRIPSGSMMPTLLVGDFILVNKFSYGLRLPVTDTKILDIGEPERGDVVVFRFPGDERIDYIKRVVGLPGDEIAYKNKTVHINGQPQQITVNGQYKGVGAGVSETGSLEAKEVLDGVEHDILINPNRPDFNRHCLKLAAGPITVPAGHYFAIGDNRDNSNDGRCWGFVPEKNLAGKATRIWMNFDGELDGFPINWRRIGDAIQ